MHVKKLWALLVAAALALSVLLTGCKGGGGESLAQVILNLLDGKYQNITVQLDPDLEADLRQAVNEGETDEEIRAALEKLLGSGIGFNIIGDGQKGDSAWNLILYPGSDPDAAARSAYLEWDKIFSAFPASGLYTAKLSMIETDNGYAILVKATVDKAARRDDDDDDDEPEDEKIKGTGFTYNVTQKTITVEPDNEAGLQNLLTKQANEDPQITAARDSGFAGVTIELAAGETYTVSQTFTTTSFKGILKGDSKASTTINITGNGLFEQIGVENGTSDSNGKVENITFKVEESISDTYADEWNGNFAGAAAGLNYGEITNCDVTIGREKIIEASDNTFGVYAGGLVGYNEEGGEITGCHVTIYGEISAQKSGGSSARAGGLVGYNDGTITDCEVTIENGGSIQATGKVDADEKSTAAFAGGIAGDITKGKITGQVTLNSGGSITATSDNASARAGGLAGSNFIGEVTGTYENKGGTITARAEKIGENTYEYEASVPTADNSNTDKEPEGTTGADIRAAAGTKWGGSSSGEPSACDPST